MTLMQICRRSLCNIDYTTDAHTPCMVVSCTPDMVIRHGRRSQYEHSCGDNRASLYKNEYFGIFE